MDKGTEVGPYPCLRRQVGPLKVRVRGFVEAPAHQVEVENMAMGVILECVIRATYVTEVEEILREGN